MGVEQVTTSGVIFYPRGLKYYNCFREYIFNNQQGIIKLVSRILKGAGYEPYNGPVSASTILDPSLAEVQYALGAILVAMAVCALFGVAKGRCFRDKGDTGDILDKVRSMYDRQLFGITNVLREKCKTRM